jgi:two-component system, NtrC family, sensor histidine kinase PilS
LSAVDLASERAAPTPGRSEAGPAAPGPARVERGSLERKLVWIMLFRLALVTVLLGLTAAWQWSTRAQEAGGALYALVFATYAASLVLALLLRTRRALEAQAFAHIVLDVAIAAVVVACTGWAESVFVFLFSLAVVSGSILLYRRGAIAAAGLSLAVYLPLVVWGPPPTMHREALPLFVHATAFLTTAALASYLAEQLRSTGERLAAREGDLATITALHESIVQSVASGLLTLTPDGRVSFLNSAGEQLVGLTLEEVQGQAADRWFSVFQGSRGRDETEFVTARGERLRLGYTIFPLVARGGRELGKAVIFQDLTQWRAMEEMVQRSERLADLGAVAAGLAHELRNPLASMTGSVELLRASAGLRQEDERLMDIVLREAARLDQLVTRFLAFSRPAPPRRARTDLAALIGETLDVFAHDPAAARVRLERGLEPAESWCDPDQIRQVLWNLLTNAAQAGGAGERLGLVRVSCAPGGQRAARFAVEDDGPGIASGDLQRIFTPFYTTKERGTGLGLAVVQRIVDAHGGTVAVESSPERGTRFTVRLPAGADGHGPGAG